MEETKCRLALEAELQELRMRLASAEVAATAGSATVPLLQPASRCLCPRQQTASESVDKCRRGALRIGCSLNSLAPPPRLLNTGLWQCPKPP